MPRRISFSSSVSEDKRACLCIVEINRFLPSSITTISRQGFFSLRGHIDERHDNGVKNISLLVRSIRQRTRSFPLDRMEILFEDRLLLAESQSEVLLQLTSNALTIRHRVRHVTIERHPRTRSFGFSIKGGHDTGKRFVSLRTSLGIL